MAKDKNTIASEVKAFVMNCGGSHSGWYVGVSSKPKQRLFNDHAVSEKNGLWIWRQCAGSEDARAIETYLLRLGMKGGSGGGDDHSDHVYAYRITPTTRE